MTKPFHPHVPEQEIVCKITKRESVLLMKLRKLTFGKVLVHKANNLIIRVEINKSEIISPDTSGLDSD